MQSSEELGNTFARSWELLTQNWIIIAPGIVIGILAAIIIWVLTIFGIGATAGFASMGMGAAGVGAAMMGMALVVIVLMIAALLNVAYTTGMAGAAWRTGKAALDDGASAFGSNASALFIAIVALFVLGVIAAGLSVFTFGLAMLAFVIFFLYTFASVIIGGHTAMDALGESCRIAARNFVMTLVVVILLAIAGMIGMWVTRILHFLPLLGFAAGYVIQNIVAAYATLVIVGEYNKLRSTVGPMGAGTGGV
jgi:hypothetical protein